MYHVELRQFPHNFCRFNLTGEELRETILHAWANGGWIELGERKWNPHQANLKVLEGPQLPVEQLSMGRGWRNAERHGRDVTEQLLAMARTAAGQQVQKLADVSSSMTGASELGLPAELGVGPDTEQGVGEQGVGLAFDVQLAADSLGLAVLEKLRDGPISLATVWAIARERYGRQSPSDCLMLAEYAVRSLVGARLAVVLKADEKGELEPCESEEQALLKIDSWTGAGGSAQILLGRA